MPKNSLTHSQSYPYSYFARVGLRKPEHLSIFSELLKNLENKLGGYEESFVFRVQQWLTFMRVASKQLLSMNFNSFSKLEDEFQDSVIKGSDWDELQKLFHYHIDNHTSLRNYRTSVRYYQEAITSGHKIEKMEDKDLHLLQNDESLFILSHQKMLSYLNGNKNMKSSRRLLQHALTISIKSEEIQPLLDHDLFDSLPKSDKLPLELAAKIRIASDPLSINSLLRDSKYQMIGPDGDVLAILVEKSIRLKAKQLLEHDFFKSWTENGNEEGEKLLELGKEIYDLNVKPAA